MARAAFWLLLLAILLLQLLGSRGQDSQRAALLGSFEKERNSRVIAMIHRQESASILGVPVAGRDRKSTRLNSSHVRISYAVFCLKTKNQHIQLTMSI